MSAADQTQKVRFVVPTLVGTTRYAPGDHDLPTDLAEQLVQAGDAQLPEGVTAEPSDAQKAAAEAAEAQRLAQEAEALRLAEQERADAEAAQAAADAQAKAAADAAAAQSAKKDGKKK